MDGGVQDSESSSPKEDKLDFESKEEECCQDLMGKDLNIQGVMDQVICSRFEENCQEPLGEGLQDSNISSNDLPSKEVMDQVQVPLGEGLQDSNISSNDLQIEERAVDPVIISRIEDICHEPLGKGFKDWKCSSLKEGKLESKKEECCQDLRGRRLTNSGRRRRNGSRCTS